MKLYPQEFSKLELSRSTRDRMNKRCKADEHALLIEAIQSLLQEKRTALKVIRVGIAVFTAQIAATGYLIMAFHRYPFVQALTSLDGCVALGMLLPSIAICLVVLGSIRLRRLEGNILTVKSPPAERVASGGPP